MSNLPESPNAYPKAKGLSTSSSGAGADLSAVMGLEPSLPVEQLISFWTDNNPLYREFALTALIKKRKTCDDLAVWLWISSGAVFQILKEITAAYRKLFPSKLTAKDFRRVYDALALLQDSPWKWGNERNTIKIFKTFYILDMCIAAHPDTKMRFVHAKMPIYLYPFLNIAESGQPLENLKVLCLGVIATLVKYDDPHRPQIVHVLLETEFFPLCLRCMESDNVTTQTLAILIVYRILMQEEGLHYCCAAADRLYAIGHLLAIILVKSSTTSSLDLLKSVIRCYLRLLEMPGARNILRLCFPVQYAETACYNALHGDPYALSLLQQLLYTLTRVTFR